MFFLVNLMLFFIVFVYGVCIGSFLNVVIYRVPNGISIAKGRSYCPKCNKKIKNYDLIPILSYILLKGKCINCKETISMRYPLIELFTGLIAVITFIARGFSLEAVIIFLIAAILIAIAMIDFDTMTIPNELIIAIVPLVLVMAYLQNDISIISRIIAFFEISIPMVILNCFVQDSFGGGDVKLISVCGIMLGWQNTLLAMFIAILIGGFYAIYLLVSGKSKKGAHIAFGPYICIGVYMAMIYGNEIINIYLNLF